jgi:hypothetical protein
MAVPRSVADKCHVLDLDEAGRVLPLVRALARRLALRLAVQARVERQLAILQLLSDTSPQPGPELDELVDHSVRFHRLAGQIDAMIERLRSMGCGVRDRDAQHVDFTTLRPDGLAVFCWRQGEDEIGHWHLLHEGHDQRRELGETTN